MASMKKNRHNYFRFTERTHSKRGIIAFLFAVLLLIGYVLMVLWSYKQDGTLSMYYGSAGIVAILLSLADLIAAAGSMSEENTYKLYPRLALLVSLLALICWGGTYVIGFL